MSVGEVVVIAALAGAAVLLLVFALQYLVSRSRNRRFGTEGFVQASRLTCPKCGQMFDYHWVPGASLTAVRLGPRRYMACPLCHRWSMFDVWNATPGPAARTP